MDRLERPCGKADPIAHILSIVAAAIPLAANSSSTFNAPPCQLVCLADNYEERFIVATSPLDNPLHAGATRSITPLMHGISQPVKRSGT